MPRLDRQMFQELSQKTSFQVDLLEKVYRLTELLNELTSTELEDLLVLKGGTAINFIYLDIPRLSVDIDMDYIGSEEKDQMRDDRKIIDETLSKIFRTLDYESEKKEAYALDKYNLYYQNSVGNRDRIKLEVNYLKRTAILKPVKEEFDHIYELDDFNISTLKTEELFGRKLAAMVRRATPKDIYDIYNLLTSDIKYDSELLKKCFIFSLCLDGDPREIQFNIFNELTPREVWNALTPILRKSEDIELKKMRKKVEPFLKRMCDFSEDEESFIKALFDEETYDIEMLFDDYSYNEDILNHPGIKWRLKNI